MGITDRKRALCFAMLSFRFNNNIAIYGLPYTH